MLLFELLRLSYTVELLIILEKLLLGEAEVHHSHHRGKTENREAAHHIHKTAGCAVLEINLEAAGLFLALLALLVVLVHHSLEHKSLSDEPKLTSLRLHYIRNVVVESFSSSFFSVFLNLFIINLSSNVRVDTHRAFCEIQPYCLLQKLVGQHPKPFNNFFKTGYAPAELNIILSWKVM